ncbi:MAG TPA: OmpA family protein [Polyangiaceae bacterium]|nr:OmpA family protein [Polyangiaceae bacterium]
MLPREGVMVPLGGARVRLREREIGAEFGHEQRARNVRIAAELCRMLERGVEDLDWLAVALTLQGGRAPASRQMSRRQMQQWIAGVAREAERALAGGDWVVDPFTAPSDGVPEGASGSVESERAGEPAPRRRRPEAAEKELDWFSLRVIDEVGAPVDGARVALEISGTERVLTTNSVGLVRVDDVPDARQAKARLLDRQELTTLLKPRWQVPRAPRPFQGSHVHTKNLEQAFLDELALPAETPVTLVLTPYFECREVPGAYFEFGRSFVRSDALEVLAGTAEALRSDAGLKAIVFGHTDVTGSEALNKELSERRAKAVHALLTHDAEAWEQLFSGHGDGANWTEKWDLKEAQHMLNALGVTDDAGQPVPEHGRRDAETVQAIHRFQRGEYPDRPAEQQPLVEKDLLGPEGRRELFLAYAKRVGRTPVEKERFVRIRWGSFHGLRRVQPRESERS